MRDAAWQETSWKWYENTQAFLPLYGLHENSRCTLLSFSENAVYRVEGPGGVVHVLRLHRPHYREIAEIQAEITFIDRLIEDRVLQTPPVLPAVDGKKLVIIGSGEREQHAVLFRYFEGHMPQADGLDRDFFRLGIISARLHDYTYANAALNSLERPQWTVATTIGEQAMWGCWKHNHAMSAEQHQVLEAADQMVRRRLAAYGRPDNRWGLLHGDMRLANILSNREDMCLIDFDDCGFSWHMYELACACTFNEYAPDIESLCSNWVQGYHSQRALDDADVAMIPTMLMLRRLLMVGWFATHRHSTEAQALEDGFVETSVVMAKDYLSGGFLSDLVSGSAAA